MPSQATFEPAHRAEILLDRNALSASVHSQIRTGLNTEALPQFAWHSDPDGPSALLTLLDICTKICRSSSWVYENGLVPMFDKQGQKIKSAKIPPWPWETLPDHRESGQKGLDLQQFRLLACSHEFALQSFR